MFRQPTRAYYDPSQPPQVQHPAQKHFEAHELRRIPVIVSDVAQTEIMASSAEGRKFPQALSELFGGVVGIKEVHIDAVPKSTHFPVTEQDTHPLSGEEVRMLVITAVHADGSIDAHTWYVNASDLGCVRPQNQGFSAVATARELVRLYPHKPGGITTPPYAVESQDAEVR